MHVIYRARQENVATERISLIFNNYSCQTKIFSHIIYPFNLVANLERSVALSTELTKITLP